MSKFTKLLAMVSVSAAVAVSAVPFSVSAEDSTGPVSEQEKELVYPDPALSFDRLYYVVGVNDGYVLLNDSDSSDIFLDQSRYKAVSGNKNDLKFGDVIDVDCDVILETWPAQFGNITGIKYMGTVSEVYKDSIKDLTVTKGSLSGGNIELRDSDGTVYKWHSYGSSVKEQGMDTDIDPSKLRRTDVIRCAVEQRERYNYDLPSRPKEKVWEVVMPIKVLSQGKFVPNGDATGNGKVDVRDCSYIAKTISKGRTHELPEDADFNNDGVINIRDAAAIARALAKE